jgi:hypothetical protein
MTKIPFIFVDQKECLHTYSTYLRIISEAENVLGRIWYCPRCKFQYTQKFYTREAMPPTQGKFQ